MAQDGTTSSDILMCVKYGYLQIPAGHCPHDETPAAVHWCLKEWIASVEEDRPLCLDVGEEIVVGSEVSEVPI